MLHKRPLIISGLFCFVTVLVTQWCNRCTTTELCCPSAVMGPEDGTMTAKTGQNAVMGPEDGTMTAVKTCDATGAHCM